MVEEVRVEPLDVFFVIGDGASSSLPPIELEILGSSASQMLLKRRKNWGRDMAC